MSASQGKSSVHLDGDTINVLLQEFANRPDGANFSFTGGKILMDQGDIQVTMDHLKLAGARFRVAHAQLGGVQLDLDDLSLSDAGLEVKLNVSR